MTSPMKTFKFNTEFHEMIRFHNWKILSKWVSPGSTKFSHSKSCLRYPKRKSTSSMKWKRDHDEHSTNIFFHNIIFYAFIYLVIFGTDVYVDYSNKKSQIILILVFSFSVGVAIAYIIRSELQYDLWAELTRLLAISLQSIEMTNGVKGLFGIVSNILWGMKPLCVTSTGPQSNQQELNKTTKPKSHKVSQNQKKRRGQLQHSLHLCKYRL